MSLTEFVIPQNQYLSSRFLSWRGTNTKCLSSTQQRQFFLLGRYALYHGLRALRIAAGDEVLVPSYICKSAVDAIHACGARSVFFRVDRDCCLDLEDMQRRISPRTRALLIVHYFGFPQDLRQVRSLARDHGLFLIEDCAHVLAGTSAGEPLGSMGDASVFSWRKFLPTFDGAELVLNTQAARSRQELTRESLIFDLKMLKNMLDVRMAYHENSVMRSAWQTTTGCLQSVRKFISDSHFQEQAAPCFETTGSDFDPKLACSTISRLSQFVFAHSDITSIVAARRQNYIDLAERLAHVPGVRPLFAALPDDTCPLYFPIFFCSLRGAHRALRRLGIPATAWDGVRPSAVRDDCFPDAGFLYDNLVFLPVHQSLHGRDLDSITRAASSVCRQKTNESISSGNLPGPGITGEAIQTGSQAECKAGPSAGKETAAKKVLLVAFHFPPQTGSSGILRPLKYCRYLPEHGWQPTVLTAQPRAYERVDPGQMDEIPPHTKVIRAFALDTRKHLSIKGAYLGYAALPDRWVTWCLGAVPAGLFHVRKSKIDVIWTTFPIASAVLIGYLLHRITGIPWVADFRDSMTEEDYPREPHVRRIFRWLEKKAVLHASRLIFTARSTMQMYLQRYPQLSAENCLMIPNGYDEEDFRDLTRSASPERNARVRIHHSGLIYPEERNPVPFFAALARLKKERRIDASWFSVDLRACGNEEYYRGIVAQLGIEDLVQFLPPLPYKQALEDSNEADLLLLLQGASCDHQIPAKTYEYLRLQKPILALTSRTGDTADLLNMCGGATLADLENEEEIYRVLPEVVHAVQTRTNLLPRMEIVSKYSRQNQARELAYCLTAVAARDQAVEGVPTTRDSTVGP